MATASCRALQGGGKLLEEHSHITKLTPAQSSALDRNVGGLPKFAANILMQRSTNSWHREIGHIDGRLANRYPLAVPVD